MSFPCTAPFSTSVRPHQVLVATCTVTVSDARTLTSSTGSLPCLFYNAVGESHSCSPCLSEKFTLAASLSHRIPDRKRHIAERTSLRIRKAPETKLAVHI